MERVIRLMGAHEIRMQMGTSRQRIYQLTSGPGFPKPIAELASGKVWLAEEVELWLANRPRRGRRTCEVRSPRPRR